MINFAACSYLESLQTEVIASILGFLLSIIVNGYLKTAMYSLP